MSRITSTIMTTRDKYLQEKYGITQSIYLSMLGVCKGRCWICLRYPKDNRNLCVDHDHRTGQVRGLLCFLCNKRLIGRHRAEHSWKYLAAFYYLENGKDWRDTSTTQDTYNRQ